MNATVVDSNFVSLSFYLLVVGGLLKVGVQDGSNGLQKKVIICNITTLCFF